MDRMADSLLTQSQDMVSVATGVARTDDRVLIQNTRSAIVHHAKPNDGGHTMCGWRFAGTGQRGTGTLYRVVPNLTNLPGSMLCEKCLPTGCAIAWSVDDADLSGDE